MSVITARGKAAKESATKKNQSIDFKKVYIRLKDGDSVRVRVLSPVDYVEYLAHGSFNLGIWTQPCTKPSDQECALCEAANSDIEEFRNLYARKRYLFAFADIDEGCIRIFDATKGQAQKLIGDIEQYIEDLNEVAFIFKRTGAKTDTVYSLNPILKFKGLDKEKFDSFNGTEVEDGFFESVLHPRSRDQQLEELKKAGFPVANLGYIDENDRASKIEDNEVKNDPENIF